MQEKGRLLAARRLRHRFVMPKISAQRFRDLTEICAIAKDHSRSRHVTPFFRNFTQPYLTLSKVSRCLYYFVTWRGVIS